MYYTCFFINLAVDIVGVSRLFKLDTFAQNVWFWSMGWLVDHGIPIPPEGVSRL